ncbi:alcohol dehydrogenase catalytic domain-containing protein [Ornithinimicrobium humiphilum]|uniref:alcohol dehydrogenase catalytic domain-containing protein n=1 Tax=Ornithinimicrobium humiphilum TaxID=125288 RepID=UPI00307EDF90
MKAWIVAEPRPIGEGPLRMVEMPDPIPGPGQVRVRVEACGVCRTDLHLAEGDLQPRRPGTVPGHEVIGRVDSLGPGCDRFAVGDRVGIAWLRGTCGRCRWCRSGAENLCPRANFTGWDADGGYAELAVVNEAFAYRIPEHLEAPRAAPSCARASSATGRSSGRSCHPAGGWASTASAPPPTWWPRSPSNRARSSTS